jgi:hypothetical protein
MWDILYMHDIASGAEHCHSYWTRSSSSQLYFGHSLIGGNDKNQNRPGEPSVSQENAILDSGGPSQQHH